MAGNWSDHRHPAIRPPCSRCDRANLTGFAPTKAAAADSRRGDGPRTSDPKGVHVAYVPDRRGSSIWHGALQTLSRCTGSALFIKPAAIADECLARHPSRTKSAWSFNVDDPPIRREMVRAMADYGASSPICRTRGSGKATIAARLCGVEIEIRGARSLRSIKELAMWTIDARPLSECRPEQCKGKPRAGRIGFQGRQSVQDRLAFLARTSVRHGSGGVQPGWRDRLYLRVQQASCGRVARLGGKRSKLYGRNPYEASRIDSFISMPASSSRAIHRFIILALRGSGIRGRCPCAGHGKHFAIYAAGIDQALQADRRFLVGDGVIAGRYLLRGRALPVPERASPLANARQSMASPPDPERGSGGKRSRGRPVISTG